ncbi:hypothetical protein FPANT_3999 [Fusarium pseudoanthophilum]|uniref:Uncharacterized protein n=1 Tax=Fusarium pseudoanthophilum TaxID=48495 RepID=A0A8H5USI2_9HYPO|nr:hypothetical protein FPANT_3999 [Fusarium pseudoanthophilum]
MTSTVLNFEGWHLYSDALGSAPPPSSRTKLHAWIPLLKLAVVRARRLAAPAADWRVQFVSMRVSQKWTFYTGYPKEHEAMTSTLDSRFDQVIGSPLKLEFRTLITISFAFGGNSSPWNPNAFGSYWPNLEGSINNKIPSKNLSIECIVCRTDVTRFPKITSSHGQSLDLMTPLCRPEDIAPIEESLKKSGFKTAS